MGKVQILRPPLLSEDLSALFARGVASTMHDNWLIAHGTLRDRERQMEVLGRTVPRPEPVVLRGYVRSEIEFDGGKFSDLIGGQCKEKHVITDAKLIPVTFEEIHDKINPYETDHYTLNAVFIPNWGMVLCYFGRRSFESWGVIRRPSIVDIPRQLAEGRRRGLP